MEKGILTEVSSRTERLEQVQSDQTRALLELQNITQGNHWETNSRIHQLENKVTHDIHRDDITQESLGSIDGIYHIPDRVNIERTNC